MSKVRRWGPARAAVVVLLIAAALIVATRLSRSLFERRRSGTASTASKPDDPGIFQVVLAEGPVEVMRGGAWMPIKQGDLLTRDEVVRTGVGGRAALRLAIGTEIELREKVEIKLDRLSAAGSTVDLRRGKVVARVSTPQGGIAVTALRTRTTNDGPAHFVVMADDHGQVSVAALEGSARFAAGGKTVTVPAGRQTRSRTGGPPEDPEKIPEEVLLQVVWPSGEKHGETTPIEGRASRSAMVTVNGAAAEVDDQGRFAAEVPLREGANVVEVESEDLSGNTQRTSATVMRRLARPPKLSTEPADLWKKQ